MPSIRVAVSTLPVSAGVSATVAAANVSYVLISSDARLDTSGRYRFVPSIAVVTDRAAALVHKVFSDVQGAADARAFETQKGLADAVSFSDYLLATLIFIREFQDAQVVQDSPAIGFAKPVTDTAAASDYAANTISKLISDGVAVSDLFGAVDGLLYAFAKATSNVVLVADAANAHTSKANSDMIAVGDSGVVSMQGYAEFGYFFEDYVGASRAF
jgi:hypothetical protein